MEQMSKFAQTETRIRIAGFVDPLDSSHTREHTGSVVIYKRKINRNMRYVQMWVDKTQVRDENMFYVIELREAHG